MVNHEKIPSSIPSIISTASSVTKYPDFRITSRTAFNKLSASSSLSNRNPAVAFNTNGVFSRADNGTNSFAFKSNCSIDTAPFKKKKKIIQLLQCKTWIATTTTITMWRYAYFLRFTVIVWQSRLSFSIQLLVKYQAFIHKGRIELVGQHSTTRRSSIHNNRISYISSMTQFGSNTID